MHQQLQLGKYSDRLTGPYQKGVCPVQAGPLDDFSSSGTAHRWLRESLGEPSRCFPTATVRQSQFSEGRWMSRTFETIPESSKRRYWKKADGSLCARLAKSMVSIPKTP